MNRTYSCALGKSGPKLAKVEGDGATPVGRWPLLYLLYRPDRMAKPITRLPIKALNPGDGWCDDPKHASYNKFITEPFGAGYEVLWRNDEIYDLIVVLGYNTDPIVPSRGSAIFLHLARQTFAPTRGCVALKLEDLIEILINCDQKSELIIHPP